MVLLQNNKIKFCPFCLLLLMVMEVVMTVTVTVAVTVGRWR